VRGDKPDQYQKESEPVELTVGDGQQPGDDCGLRRDDQDDGAGSVEKLRDGVQPADLFDARTIKTCEGPEPKFRLRPGDRRCLA
jgi:hypothetical protein